MNRALVPRQVELVPALPRVVGNVDYQEFERQLRRIDELFRHSGIEERFVATRLAAMEEEGRAQAQREGKPFREWTWAQRARAQRMATLALRCNVVRQLTEKAYRRFTRHLAESPLLQWFCQIARLDCVRVPTKSTLQRYEALAPEAEVRALVTELNRQASAAPATPTPSPAAAPLGLEVAVDLDAYWGDTTCVEAHIHFPVDWVLLRDAVRTLMKAIAVIRAHGLKHRMEPPEVFLRRMNRLAIEMTHARGKTNSRKQRKQVLRRMKRLCVVVRAHAQRYHQRLAEHWQQETDLKRGEVQQLLERIAKILNQLPVAIRQAHERIIGERPVANADKVLSLYEEEIHVVVRGKPQARVEFGNSLYLGEQRDGLIVDWKLLQDSSPGDPSLLWEGLQRFHFAYGRYPSQVGADRGFDSAQSRRELEAHAIANGICPRAIPQLRERMNDPTFAALQRRRSQTEGRIAILQDDFLGHPLRNKGFASRELAVAWAVLAHNLWVLARLPQAQSAARQKKKAA